MSIFGFQIEKCIKRKVKCLYCELSYDLSKLAEHESHCGARTEVCDLCNRRVQYKDKLRHDASNCEFPEQANAATRQPDRDQETDYEFDIPLSSHLSALREALGAVSFDPCETTSEK